MYVLPTEVFCDYAEHPLVKRLYLTDVGFFPNADYHYRERREGIEAYIFLYCTEGEGIVYVKGQEYLLQKNEAFCIPAHEAHHYYSSKVNPWSLLWVHFKGEDVGMFPLEDCKVINLKSENAINRMLFLFELLFRVLDGNYTLGNFIYISQVLSLILAEAYYREKQDSTLEENKQVTNVIKYMYQHLSKEITLDQLSEEFNLSKSYLNVIFRKYTQHTPMDFYNKLKMKEACKLLRSSDNAYVYEVAQMLGYKDQYYFSRIFKKTVGVSPKTYKNTNYLPYKE